MSFFLPELAVYLERDSISFIDKEVFTDVTAGERYETDLLVKVRFQGKESFFLVHLEHQAQHQETFPQQGELAIIQRLLIRRFGGVTPQLQERLRLLSLTQLEDLAEALLDFSTDEDLLIWLQKISDGTQSQ